MYVFIESLGSWTHLDSSIPDPQPVVFKNCLSGKKALIYSIYRFL